MKKGLWKKRLTSTLGLALCLSILFLPLPAAAYEEETTVYSEPETVSQELTDSVPSTPDIETTDTVETTDIIEETASTEPIDMETQEEAAIYESRPPQISYAAYVQTYGWMDWVKGGEESGTTNQAKRLEAFHIRLENTSSLSGDVEYCSHVQTYGWMDWVKSGEESGTTNQAKRLEAIRIRLTGELATQYDIYYRVHCQTFGWTGWAKNGAPAGSMGYAKRLEAIQITLVEKGGPAPGNTADTYREDLKVTYQTHVQTYGFLAETSNGVINGTTGEAKRMEGIKIRLENHSLVPGSIEYRTHVQTYGWQGWVKEGELSGTTGEAKRLEALEIRLTGEMAKKYDIYYRVHCQTFGWTGWASNGTPAGSEGYAKRLEAVEIRLVKKDEGAPGPTDRTYFHKTGSFKITQYGSNTGSQLMCYTIEDQNGNLAIIDGGYEKDADMLREIIKKHDNHVSAWILTHPHPDHIGAFNAILEASGAIQIDQIYTVPVNYDRYRETAKSYDEFEVYEKFLNLTKNMKNIHYVSENEEFDLLGLDVKVLHVWDDSTGQLDDNLCNNGSMVFVLKGKQEKMLFLSDMENETEAQILKRHQDELDADYVQAGHHGNWGPSLDFYAMLSPRQVFMDAPAWLLRENSIYDAFMLKKFFEKKGSSVFTFSTAPNEIMIY